MTLISDKTYPRTLDTLVDRLLRCASAGQRVVAWLFDDERDRRQAEAKLADAGITARLHSAYKPLLHFFLEDLDSAMADIVAVTIDYPICEQAPENRFLLETYPLAALYPHIHFTFTAKRRNSPIYELHVQGAEGKSVPHEVFAPNRLHRDPVGEQYLSPTGWLKLYDLNGTPIADERLETDYEALFADSVESIAGYPWRDTEPFFDELNISVTLTGSERTLGWGQEVISLQEALHEDLYFSLLELFQHRAGRPLGDRNLQPGQIVPEVRFGKGDARVVITTQPLSATDLPALSQELTTASAPLSVAQVAAELSAIVGTSFAARSLAGRTVPAIYHSGSDYPVMISGGQHANETSGVIGALRAAKGLAERDSTHFTVAPLENPDGYALHQRLIRDNPKHMHHAARYTALGDDLGHRQDDLYEAAIRRQALQVSGAQLHINLHGYPSHEWTRPLSGYIPRGFALWTLPKGFFLILRHHLSWAAEAELFLSRLTSRLATVPGLQAFNAEQISLYRRHSGTQGFAMSHGFPYLLEPLDNPEIPLVLITEYPDETCHGAAFLCAHDAQTATALAAYDVFQQLMAEKSV